MAKRPRIVLTMIVKDEAKVIRRCLESVRPYIDAWAIADTGSTDGTQDLIREILSGIPGTLLERPWVDFATNRNEAIEAAQQYSPEYCMTLDADEEFTVSPGFTLAGLVADAYSSMFEMQGSGARWPRKVLFKSHLRYKFVLDETIVGCETQGLLPACLVKSYTDGARSNAGMKEKHARDCEVLRAAVEREPNEPRYWFYLAKRLMGMEAHEEALAAFRRRVELGGGTGGEVGHSRTMIGLCLYVLKRPFEEVQAAFLASWQHSPTRAEPLYALACAHMDRKEYALAELYARAAHKVPRPSAGEVVEVDESIYAYRALELVAGALAEQGKFAEARDLLRKLLALPQLPETERERVAENIGILTSAIGDTPTTAPALGPDERTYEGQASALREHGLFAGFRSMGLEYLSSFAAQSLPSPIRWLWILCAALFGRWAAVAGAVAAAPLAAWSVSPFIGMEPAMVLGAGSPLLFLAGRRRLQDAPVAALTLAAIGFALRGQSLGLGLTLFALLGLKEAAVLTLPALALAWHYSGSGWAPFVTATGAAAAAALSVLLALFGTMALPMLRAGSKGHSTPYTLEHQRGAWHRLLVDLVLVSPISTLAAFYGSPEVLSLAAALVGSHLIAPVRNVRLVLAADLLLRMSAVFAFGWWILPALAVDFYISRRLRAVYDPVTAALTSQLGMSR